MLKNNKRQKMLLLSLIMVLLVGVGAVLAYIHMQTQEVVNEFMPAKVDIEVVETFDGIEKKDVCISNILDEKNVPAYIRAEIVVTWKKIVSGADGKISYETYGKAPTTDEYSIDINTAYWGEEAEDGFYYYPNIVSPGSATLALINSCKLKPDVVPPEGYFFDVEVVASAIQADGVSADEIPAVVDAWGVAYDPETKTISKE